MLQKSCSWSDVKIKDSLYFAFVFIFLYLFGKASMQRVKRGASYSVMPKRMQSRQVDPCTYLVILQAKFGSPPPLPTMAPEFFWSSTYVVGLRKVDPSPRKMVEFDTCHFYVSPSLLMVTNWPLNVRFRKGLLSAWFQVGNDLQTWRMMVWTLYLNQKTNTNANRTYRKSQTCFNSISRNGTAICRMESGYGEGLHETPKTYWRSFVFLWGSKVNKTPRTWHR